MNLISSGYESFNMDCVWTWTGPSDAAVLLLITSEHWWRVETLQSLGLGLGQVQSSVVAQNGCCQETRSLRSRSPFPTCTQGQRQVSVG